MLITKVVGIYLKGRKNNKQKLTYSCKKILNKKDPLDKQILKLAKKGELNVGVVQVKEAPNLII